MTRTREENAADLAYEEARLKTKAATLVAMIAELIETHMAKCDELGGPGIDVVPHVVSEAHGTSANINSIATAELGAVQLIELQLDDGTWFDIRVEEV
jgi:hypothetical protein